MSKYIFYIYSDNFYVLIREKKRGISADYNKDLFIYIYYKKYIYIYYIKWIEQ